MIARAQFYSAPPTTLSTPLIARDALIRVPSAHFSNMPWAQATIATCLTVLDAAAAGDRTRAIQWISTAGVSDHVALEAVVSAVCDAVVADAFQTQSDIRATTTFVAAFEREMHAELAAYRQKDVDVMNDSDTADLAAGLVRIVQLHDYDTAIHLDATAVLARRIAGAMGLSDGCVRTTELAARLHDIGKVGVSKTVLCKPGPLTVDEWGEMRLHAEVGAAVLSDTPRLAHLAPIVRAHHERIDGTGYPDRLRADEIPLEARIIAVADAFHAMTTTRSYRAAMMPSEALKIVAENAGTQFDLDVVEATFELFGYARRAHRAIA